MCPSIYLFIFCLQKMWCWTEDGLGQPSGVKTATKHKIQKRNLETDKKKNSVFLASTRSSLFFLKFSFLKKKKKKELRHCQKWDKLFRWLFKQACCFIEFKFKEKKRDLEWDTVSGELRNCELRKKKKKTTTKNFKTVNWEINGNTI